MKIGLLDFWRNRISSLAATLMMTMTVFTIALFMLLNFSINQTAQALQQKIDVAVFFKDTATDQQITSLENLLKNRSDVSQVDYVSRELALQQFKEQSKYRSAVLTLLNQGYGTNLPRSLSIKANDPSSLDAIATFVQQPPYDTLIEHLSYQENKDLINKYINSTAFIKKTGLILSGLFILIAILVIYNTILLTIFMRKEEIGIMQLVGATGWYIRFPFILEGILYGIIATIITTVVLIVGVRTAGPYITRYVDSSSFDFERFFVSFLPLITAVELGIGVVIGALCSFFAVRKHLK